MKSLLRNFIREALRQSPAGPGVSADPTASSTPAESERGVDIYGYWYKSPGDKSTGGNPGRPDDAEEYIGFKTKGVRPDDAAADLAPPPIAEV